MNPRRILVFLLVVFALFGCRRSKNGNLVVDVPTVVAATVLGGGATLLDPLATTALLVGVVTLRNDLAIGTANGGIDYRVDCPPGCEASESSVRLQPGEERIVQIFSTLALAAVITVTVFAIYATAGGSERAFPLEWQNYGAASAAFTLLSLISPDFAVLWAGSAVLTAIAVLTGNSNPLVPRRVPALAQDVRMFGAIIGLLTLIQLQTLFGDVDGPVSETFPPGQSAEGLTVPASPGAPMVAGEYVTFWMSTAADIPLASSTELLQYAVVVDSDLNPANNWVPIPAFPDDFFKDTDRWYELNYAPGAGWTFRCRQIGPGNTITTVPSAARAIIRGDTVLVVVPRSEFAVGNPPFRVTTFSHLGDFGQNEPFVYSADPTPTVAEGLRNW